MQWLIELIAEKVIAEIGIPPVFIDRGDPVNADFSVGDFEKDSNWHVLDLSGIIPAGAKALAFYQATRCTAIHKRIFYRKNGNANARNIAAVRITVANIVHQQDLICALDEDRKIEYFFDTATWITATFTVKGWWL